MQIQAWSCVPKVMKYFGIWHRRFPKDNKDVPSGSLIDYGFMNRGQRLQTATKRSDTIRLNNAKEGKQDVSGVPEER